MVKISRDNANKIDGYWGTLDKAVEYLIDCRNKGESVYIEFNGKLLYSADVTLDSAYLQLQGLTREESMNAKKEMVEAKTNAQKEKVIKKYNALKQKHIVEQKKSAKKINEYFGTLDNAVAYLIDCRNKGESVYIEFNGELLYSADVTLDSAYLQLQGLTREESMNAKKEMVAAKTKKEKEKIIAKYLALKKAHKNNSKDGFDEI